MQVAVMSYAFYGLQQAGQMDVFGFLESVRYRYGLHACELWNGTLASIDDDYLRKVRAALDERELTLACFSVDGAHVWDPDPDVRERHYRNALAHLRAAEVLGARSVRIDFGGQSPEMSEEQFDCTVARFREYARIAADGGYRVGPETHFGPALVPENMARVHDAVANPAYGIMLHVGHWLEGREDEGDRMAAPWTFHTHFDWRITTTCLQRKMEILRDGGYTGYYCAEHHSGKNEYSEVGVQVAMISNVLEHWRDS